MQTLDPRRFIDVISSDDPAVRNLSVEALCGAATVEDLLLVCEALDGFRRDAENLYQRVRALFFLYSIHRFHLPRRIGEEGRTGSGAALIPFDGYEELLSRRFEEAIDTFLKVQARDGANDGICSGLAAAACCVPIAGNQMPSNNGSNIRPSNFLMLASTFL